MTDHNSNMENPFADPSVMMDKSSAPSHSQPTIDAGVLGDYNPFEARNTDLSGNISTAPVHPPPYATLDSHRDATEELERRQKELDAKAAELARREEEQNRLAEQNRRTGNASGSVNNWPPLPSFFPCGPCFYQDIELEIPQSYQPIVRFGYHLWMAYAALLCFNLVGSIFCFAGTDMLSGGTLFGVAILLCVFCIPASFVCWFRPLYKAFRTDSSINFFIFFIVFGAQTIVMGIQSIGIGSSGGSCGWITGLGLVKSNPGIGGFLLIIAALFTGITATSAFHLIRVHRIYRNTGASFHKARSELAQGITSDPTMRAAAMEAGMYAARQSVNGRN